MRTKNEKIFSGLAVSELGDVGGGDSGAYKTFLKKTISKANRQVGLVGLLGSHMDGLHPATASRLYKSLVRPILEFGGQVVPFSESQIAKLEIVQRTLQIWY